MVTRRSPVPTGSRNLGLECRRLPLRLSLQPQLHQAPRLYLPLPLLAEPTLQLGLLLRRLLSLPGLQPRLGL